MNGKKASVEAIARAVIRWQDATQRYDAVVGELLELTPSEMQCLTALYEGPLPAGKSAEAIGLTPAAVTSLLDRLEKRGLVRRKRNAEDRRKVMVEITPRALELAERYYGPTFREREKLLGSFAEKELSVVERFVRESLALQERQLARLDPERARRG